jgi:hypothetical protein
MGMRLPNAKELERLAIANGGTVRKVDRSALAPTGRVVAREADATFGVRHVLVIDGFLPYSLNRDMRGKIKRRCEIERATREIVAAETHRQGVPAATTARSVELHVTFPEGRSRPDPDNLGKLILDAMKNAGLLIDDSFEFCCFLPPVYYLGPARTEIHMIDIPVRVVSPRGLSPDNPKPGVIT